MKYFLTLLLGIAIGILVESYFFQPKPITVRETVTVRDTLRDTIPVPVDRYLVRKDSVPYEVLKTVVERDTVFVPIPIERREYRTDEYFAIVEGYKPTLYYMETYQKTVFQNIVQHEKVKPRWGVGVHAGFGATKNGFTPYLGVGIHYNLITW